MTPTPPLVERLRAKGSAGWCALGPDRSCGGCAHCIYTPLLREAAAALASRDKYIDACESMIRQHAKAADIFQPGGRFHECASFLLGDSAVVAGIAWLTAEYDRLTAALTAERAAREEAGRNYNGACQTIARMHEAATGRSGEAPIRGVVEDLADMRAERDALAAQVAARGDAPA